jgi:hypothetical protein
MLVIGALAFLAVVGFGLIVVTTVVVTIGVRQEERYRTLKHGRAPGPLAGLTRVTLGHYVRQHDDEPAPAAPPDDVLPWYERSPGPARR